MKCLMIETNEKKKIFTLVGNGKKLHEFCRAIKAKMFVVEAKIKKSQVKSIPKIVTAVCDKNEEGTKAEYKVLRTIELEKNKKKPTRKI